MPFDAQPVPSCFEGSDPVVGDDPNRSQGDIHICLCSDDPDLRPMAVAINSTIATSRRPERLVFHVVTTPEASSDFETRLRAWLPLQVVCACAGVRCEEALGSSLEGVSVVARGKRVGAAPTATVAHGAWWEGTWAHLQCLCMGALTGSGVVMFAFLWFAGYAVARPSTPPTLRAVR